MKWNGRRLIPVGAIPVYPKKQDDIRELLKPLSEKRDRGNVWVPVLNQPINIQKDGVTPVVSASPTPTPSVTPTITPTMTMTVTPTMTQTPTPSASPAPSVDPDYQAVLNYATSQGYVLPSVSGQTLQNDLVVDLKAAGVWSDLDIFYVFATDGDSDFSRINWKNPNSFLITTPLPVTFTSKQGFSSISNSYLDTNFTPSSQGTGYTLNDAARIYYDYNNDTSVAAVAYDGNVIEGINQSDRWAGINTNNLKITSYNNLSGTFDNTGIGLKMIQRTSSSNVNLYNNSAIATSFTQISSNVDSQPHTILRNTAGAAGLSSNICSMFGMGASMSGKESDLFTSVNTYMTSL